MKMAMHGSAQLTSDFAAKPVQYVPVARFSPATMIWLLCGLIWRRIGCTKKMSLYCQIILPLIPTKRCGGDVNSDTSGRLV